MQAGLAKEGREKSKPFDAFRHRIMFPIRNLSGKVIAFGGRRLREDSDQPEAKYINSPETAVYRKGRELFGLWEARNDIRRQERAILVEGYTDCLSLVMAGVKVAVASLGTALTEEQARLLVRFTPNVFIFYDGDSAGMAAARRALDVLISASAQPKVMLLPAEDDPDSLVQERGAEAIWKLVNEARGPVEFQFELIARGGQPLPEAIKDLVATAARISSPVEQELFLQSVSARTGISGEALQKELAQQRKSLPHATENRRPVREIWPAPGPLNSLSRILIAEPDLRDEVFRRWKPEAVVDGRLKSILDDLYREWQSGEMREAETILDRFEDSQLRDFLSECLFEKISEEDPDQAKKLVTLRKIALDCVGKLEADEVQQQIAVLRRDLATRPDNEADLLRRMQELIKKEKSLRAGVV